MKRREKGSRQVRICKAARPDTLFIGDLRADFADCQPGDGVPPGAALDAVFAGSGPLLGQVCCPHSSILRGRVLPGPGLEGVAARGGAGLKCSDSGAVSF